MREDVKREDWREWGRRETRKKIWHGTWQDVEELVGIFGCTIRMGEGGRGRGGKEGVKKLM